MLQLHVISPDLPFPLNRGEALDTFYLIENLSQLGMHIHLHAFTSSRVSYESLEGICESVRYYAKKKSLRPLPVKYPQSVSSRALDDLLVNLLGDEAPILFIGNTTTYFLGHPDLSQRVKMVRMHNLEWEHYYQLAQQEPNILRRKYYSAESRLLKEWESMLEYADLILPISPKGTAYMKGLYPKKTQFLPAFHPFEQVSSIAGQGGYCLFHGNLGMDDAHESVLFLIEEVFQYMPDIPLIVAGADPQPEIIEAISAFNHIVLRPNPGEHEMMDLLHQAHIHVLPTLRSASVKHKLIHSLFTGRFVMVNPYMINQTGLEFSTIVADDAVSFRGQIRAYWEQPFTEIEIAQRKATLSPTYNNFLNAQRLSSLLNNGKLV